MTLDSLPDLDTSGLCLVKTLSTARRVGRIGTRRSGTAPEHPRALRRSPKGGRPRYTAGPRRRGKPKHSHRGHPVGAQARKLGKFELAQGGTVFLDEIGSLRPDLQAKVLRVQDAGDIDASTPGTSTPGRRRPIASRARPTRCSSSPKSAWRAEGAGRPEPSSRPTRRRRSRPVGQPSHRTPGLRAPGLIRAEMGTITP